MEDQLGGRSGIARLEELASRQWNVPLQGGLQVYHITYHDKGHIVKPDRGILGQLSLKRLWPPLPRESMADIVNISQRSPTRSRT